LQTPSPLISVIICTYNRQDYITGALDSLKHQTLAKENFEVIVADNKSSDNTATLVKDYIEANSDVAITYVLEEAQGASFARNTGASLARSPLLVFMDDDAIAEKKYLAAILKFYAERPDACGLGGRIIPKYIPEEPAWMSHYVSSLVGNFNYSQQAEEFKPGKYPLESNMVVKKEDFDLVGGFNTALPGVKGTLRIGGEGKDFFLKLQKRGKKIFYDPNIVVHHIVEVKKLTSEYMYRVASGIGRGERVRTKQKGTSAFVLKHTEYLFKLGASVILGAGYVLQGRPQKAAPVIMFRINAIKGLIGK